MFQRKIVLLLDSNTYEVLHYIDNEPLLAIYQPLQAVESTVTKEEAYEKLKERIELTPYYVYDVEEGHYVLRGKLDCQYAVRAADGEVVKWSELCWIRICHTE